MNINCHTKPGECARRYPRESAHTIQEPRKLVTAESVRAGHPDKFCDQIADAILDAHIEQDPDARVAVEAFATRGKILIAGEVSSTADVHYRQIVANVIDRIGYKTADLCEEKDFCAKMSGSCKSNYEPLALEVRIHKQSSDIAAAVDAPSDAPKSAPFGKSLLEENLTIGAGDQGIVVGYATDETADYLPLPVVLAHRICRRLDGLMPYNAWLGADGKAQITMVYGNGLPVSVDTIVVSVQHDENVPRSTVRRFVEKEVLRTVIPKRLITDDTKVLINPSGRFVLGGPAADTGLTGRKLAVDQYGTAAHIGGGALSGKDPTKVDRSGAYAARWVAKNVVAAGIAQRCEVQIAYAIGQCRPVSVSVNTFGTGAIADDAIEKAVNAVFNLTPSGIIDALRLKKPIYSDLTCYGHFGRKGAPWEDTGKADVLASAVLDELPG